MKLLKNVTAAFTANAVTAGAQYVLVVLVARRLGPDAFGTFVFALTFGGLLAVLPNFGLDRVLLRQVIRDRGRTSAWFTSAAALRLGLAGAALLLAAALVPWVAPAGAPRGAILLIVVSLVLALAAELCRALLYASDALPLETTLRLTGRLIMLAGAVTAVLAGGTLQHLGIALAATALVEGALYVGGVVRRLRIGWARPAPAMMRTLAAAAAPIAFNTLFVLLYFRANLLMVTAWAGLPAAGQFGAAFTFLQVLQVASASLASVVLPHFVHHDASGAGPIAPRVETITRLLLLAIVPVAAAMSLLAPEIVQVVYSSRYAPAIPALQILAWASVFMFAGSLHGTLLIALDAERALFWLSLGAVIGSVTANLLLIPRYGILGASWATVGTEALVGLTTMALVRRRIGVPRLQALAWPGVVGALVIAVQATTTALPLPARLMLAAGTALAAAVGFRRAAGPWWDSVWGALARGGARA
jgi:O-antigen/teichoic acid export membrane protein